jgi:hypothetical protein
MNIYPEAMQHGNTPPFQRRFCGKDNQAGFLAPDHSYRDLPAKNCSGLKAVCLCIQWRDRADLLHAFGLPYYP